MTTKRSARSAIHCAPSAAEASKAHSSNHSPGTSLNRRSSCRPPGVASRRCKSAGLRRPVEIVVWGGNRREPEGGNPKCRVTACHPRSVKDPANRMSAGRCPLRRARKYVASAVVLPTPAAPTTATKRGRRCAVTTSKSVAPRDCPVQEGRCPEISVLRASVPPPQSSQSPWLALPSRQGVSGAKQCLREQPL